MSIRVFIVDDQSLIRSGLAAVLDLAPDIETVGEASDGAEAIAKIRETEPDVVLMDLHMPRVSGVEATTQLLRFPNPPRVLVLTTYDMDDLVLDALEAGAAGFLLKDLRPDELTSAVRNVAVGGNVFTSEITKKLVGKVRVRTPIRVSDFHKKLNTLSTTEQQVLALIGEGLTNRQIADILHLAPSSVKTYVSKILGRLGLENRTQAAILAYTEGLVRGHDQSADG